MNKFCIILFVLFGLSYPELYAQKGQFGINQDSIHPSALLDIKSIKGGLLVPRLTFAQSSLINNPVEGLLLYQNDNTKGFRFRTGSTWPRVFSGADSIFLFPSRRPDIRYRNRENIGLRNWVQHIAWVDDQRGDIYRFSPLSTTGTEFSTVTGDVIFEGGNIHIKRSGSNVMEFECEPDSLNILIGRLPNGNGLTIEVSHDGLVNKSTPFGVRGFSPVNDIQSWWDSTGLSLSAITADGSFKIQEAGLLMDEKAAVPKLGLAKLLNGSIFIPNSSVSSKSRIMLCNNGLIGVPGELSVSIQSGSGFTINSSSAIDESEIAWFIIESL